MHQSDLYAKPRNSYASMRPLSIYLIMRQNGLNWEEQDRPIKSRYYINEKDPPFDLDYIYTTYMLEIAHNKGVVTTHKVYETV